MARFAFARKREFVEPDQCDLGRPVLCLKIFHFPRRANHLYKLAPSHPNKGALRTSRTRGGTRMARNDGRA
jgi:hypothetical protein